MKRAGRGVAVLAAASSMWACGAGVTVNDWVGIYTGKDTYALVDGGTGSNDFEVNVTPLPESGSAGGVSIGGFQNGGRIYKPFDVLLNAERVSASMKCPSGMPGVHGSAALHDKKTLILNGADCATDVTFSGSVTKK